MAKIVLFTSYDRICLGIRVLSSVLRKEGHDVSLIFFKTDYNAPITPDIHPKVMYTTYRAGYIEGCNYDINPYTKKEEHIFRDLIKTLSPDIIGLSTRTFWLEFGKSLMAKIGVDNPKSIILAGGYGPSIMPYEFSKLVNYIVFGEGEDAFKKIAKCVDNNDYSNIKNINNVGFIDKQNDLVINHPSPPIKNLDNLPYPDWEDEQSYYIEGDKLITNPTAVRHVHWYDLFACRGCPSNCSFCMASHWRNLYKQYGTISFPKLRTRSPQNVLEEIIYQKTHKDIEYVRFMDSIFSTSIKWLEHFLPGYIHKINLPFFCNIEVRFQSYKLLEMLCDGGMSHTSLGIQSGSNFIRENILSRKIKNSEIIRAAKLLNKRGVKYQQDIIGFNPFDTEYTLKETFDLICSLPPNPIVVFTLNIFPNSNLDKLYNLQNPNELNKIYHLIWIYLWHIASFGGKQRQYAKKIVEKYNGKTPIDMLNEIEERWKDLRNHEINKR